MSVLDPMNRPGPSLSSLRSSSVRDSVRMLQGLSDRARDLTPVWPAVGDIVAADFRRQFDTEGAEHGSPWAPLSPAYAASKLRRYGAEPILVRQGELRRQFTDRPMDIERYSPTFAVYGASGWLPVWHQYGTRTRGGKRKMRARPIMRKTPELVRAMNEKITDYLLTGRR